MDHTSFSIKTGLTKEGELWKLSSSEPTNLSMCASAISQLSGSNLDFYPGTLLKQSPSDSCMWRACGALATADIPLTLFIDMVIIILMYFLNIHMGSFDSPILPQCLQIFFYWGFPTSFPKTS